MVLMENHRTETYQSTPSTSHEVEAAPARPRKKTNIRTCIVTRQEADKAELLRFVCNKSGELYFDVNHKLPGRGMYLYPAPGNLQTALDKNLFAKAAKQKIDVPVDFKDQIQKLLRKSILDYIGLARRAGELIISLDKIEKYFKNNPISCYITSSSENSDGYRKIGSKLDHDLIITEFSNEELSQILKLENAVHLAMKEGELSEVFLKKYTIYKNL